MRQGTEDGGASARPDSCRRRPTARSATGAPADPAVAAPRPASAAERPQGHHGTDHRGDPADGTCRAHDHGDPRGWDPFRTVPPTPTPGGTAPRRSRRPGRFERHRQRGPPSWAYIPWNIAVAGTLVWVARRWGPDDSRPRLGLAPGPDPLRSHLGGLAATAVVGTTAVGALLPLTRELFQDDRAAGLSLGGLATYAWSRSRSARSGGGDDVPRRPAGDVPEALRPPSELGGARRPGGRDPVRAVARAVTRPGGEQHRARTCRSAWVSPSRSPAAWRPPRWPDWASPG